MGNGDESAGGSSGHSPVWGTPPRQGSAPAQETPSWGTPPLEATQRQATPPASQDSSGPVPGQRLLTANTIAVIEQSGFLSGRAYELVAADGSPLGSLSEQVSAGGWIFGTAASSTFTLTDPSGAVVAIMHRPGSIGRFQFIVSDAEGAEAGMVEQENSFFAPQFRLATPDGIVMRLTGGSLGSTGWELSDESDGSLLGSVNQEFAGLGGILGGTQRFAVRLSPVLTGGTRLLAVMATVCLDYVRDARRRR